MSDRESSLPPDAARTADLRYSPALRVGRAVYVSGHIGRRDDGVLSDDPEEQIRTAFVEVGRSLAELGATWRDVVEITSYHVGLQAQREAVTRVHRDFIEEPYPAWTAVGVSELLAPGAVVEISVVALLPDG